jgi:hypothetical protein
MSTMKPNTLYTGTERLHTTLLSNQTLPNFANEVEAIVLRVKA